MLRVLSPLHRDLEHDLRLRQHYSLLTGDFDKSWRCRNSVRSSFALL